MTGRIAIALAALIGCAGCVAPAAPPLPPVQARIADANARAAGLLRAGNDAAAVRLYEEALRLGRSIEDTDAIAAAAVNLSIVHQRLGDDAAARASLAIVTDDSHLAFPERRRVQVELRRAILDLAARDASGAALWAERAAERCARSACELAAAILNVKAQIALDAGRGQEAAQLAQQAAQAARARADQVELANALRTTGRARRELNDLPGALQALEETLALDRALADPRKILVDLTELGRTSAAQRERVAARGYFERALAVGKAVRDARGIEEIDADLRALDER